jgi:hypothetical protein
LLTLLSPLAFPLDLDPGAVDQEMQRTLRRPMLDVHGKGLLATAERAEVRHIPVQADQGKQALDETRRLPRRHCRLDQWRSNVDHAEKDIHRQAGLDCGVAVDGLSPTLAGRLGRPDHARIEPDRQRPAALERVRHCARTMYGWLPRGKGVSGDAGVISVAAMYTASGLQRDCCAP